MIDIEDRICTCCELCVEDLPCQPLRCGDRCPSQCSCGEHLGARVPAWPYHPVDVGWDELGE